MGVEAASIGVQVHGGMGFIEETGAAQHYRDARIMPIYEGTNGIQAIDLIGRKLSLEGGEVVRRFLGEVHETASLCERARRRRRRHRQGTRARRQSRRQRHRLAARTPAHLAERSAPRRKPLSAHDGPGRRRTLPRARRARRGRAPREGRHRQNIPETRIAVAQFFAEQILPQAEAQLGPITRGAGGAFRLERGGDRRLTLSTRICLPLDSTALAMLR